MVQPSAGGEKALVVGYGRVGKRVCALLSEHQIPFIAIDHNVSTVSSERHRGRHEVFYGDAADEAFLQACGLLTATGLIITMDAHDKASEIVRAARNARPDLLIVARAHDAEHARSLYAVGATTAVPETIEASFQLSEAALIGLGVATGLAIASIHEPRDRVRETLKRAAEQGTRPDVG
jgi:CPA2 family monovalent cation:H+ antiporter-2